MMPLKLLTARSTVISLIAAFTCSLLGALFVPQSRVPGVPPPWVGRLPELLRPAVGWLGLDNIVGSGWFLVLVALCCLSLALSTVSQFQTARSQTRRPPRDTPLPEGVRLELGLGEVAATLERAGFRYVASAGGTHRYVKYRCGYWGGFLLHLGMVVAIAFCLVYLVTQHRAFLRLVDQESTRFIPGTFDEVLGAERFRQRLPDSITLTRLEPVFWGNDRLASLASRLTITDRPGDQPRRVDVALSDKSQFGPFIVYQANAFGVAFDLELLSPEGGMSQERLFLPYPAARDKAGYGEKTLKGGVLLLKGKFYADAELKGIRLSTPLLILRLYRGGEFLGETRLTPGTSGAIGPYVFKLAQAQWWTSVLLDGSRGMSGIFAGFALLLAGVLGSYCLVPREVIVREEPGGVRLQHLVRRFAPFYREEFDDLIQAARQKGES